MKRHDQQQGVVLIALLAVLALLLTGVSLKQLNNAHLQYLKREKTRLVLAEAKQALLAYSTESLTATNCNQNCPRPGDLPCPDLDNNGEAESSCNTQASRLGRLPWKTLGLNDLKDGAGESLWYAVSMRYKNNTRVLPLNSETTGTISLRNQQGALLFNADNTVDTGLAAVIIAPNAPLTRLDGLQQIRSQTNQNLAAHYLDTTNDEDNAEFIEGSENGFISGWIKTQQNTIVNDVVLAVTSDQIHQVMEKRVLYEVILAMLNYQCSNDANYTTRTCNTSSVDLPFPASSTDINCLNHTTINVSDCLSIAQTILGRIPANQIVSSETETNYASIWTTNDSQSILRGDADDNWFQQNGWRELIYYARMPDCEDESCTYLKLKHALTPLDTPSEHNKSAVLISSGKPISSQTRGNKLLTSNYLEGDNINNPDTSFARQRTSNTVNDLATSIP